jgi:hypothetical protein
MMHLLTHCLRCGCALAAASGGCPDLHCTSCHLLLLLLLLELKLLRHAAC